MQITALLNPGALRLGLLLCVNVRLEKQSGLEGGADDDPRAHAPTGGVCHASRPTPRRR